MPLMNRKAQIDGDDKDSPNNVDDNDDEIEAEEYNDELARTVSDS